MTSYKIVVSQTFDKDIRKLPPKIIKKVATVVDNLSKDPRPDGCKKLKGAHAEEYRIKVKREYRILYQIFDKKKIVHVLRVLARKEAYS